MTRIVSIFNIKGGVGKTTSTVNIAYSAAKSGLKTLIWDMDPQGAASFYLRINSKVKGGLDGMVHGKHEAADHIKGSDFENLEILPADMSYRNMDKELLEVSKRSSKGLKKLLMPALEEYDLVLVDCPPHLSESVAGIIKLSDLLLVPTIPTVLSMRTVKQLKKFIVKDQKIDTPFRVFFSQVDLRRKMHKEIVAFFLENNGKAILKTGIPVMSEVEKMGIARAPIGHFAPRHKAAALYQTLFEEIITMLDKQKTD